MGNGKSARGHPPGAARRNRRVTRCQRSRNPGSAIRSPARADGRRGAPAFGARPLRSRPVGPRRANPGRPRYVRGVNVSASRPGLPRLAAVLLLLLALVFIVGGKDPAGVHPGFVRGVDLASYWIGGTILAAGDDEELYSRRRSAAELKALFPPKPPFYPVAYPPPIYQLLALPQPTVPYAVAARVMLGLFAALHLVGATLVVRAGPDLGKWRGAVLAAAFVCPGAVSVVVSGQLAGLWVTFLGLGLWARAQGRPILGGVALAGLWLKPTLAAPAFFALVLLGEGQLIGGMILGGGLILAASLAAGGFVAWQEYVELMLHPGKVMKSMFSRIDRHLTLRALFAGIAPKDWAATAGWVGAGVAAIGAAALSWVGRRADDAPSRALRFSAVLVAAFLASPHFYEYDAALHLPATVASAAWLASGRAAYPRAGWVLGLLGLLAGGIVLVDKFIGFNLATILVAAWVGWMGAELARARGAAAAGAPSPSPAD